MYELWKVSGQDTPVVNVNGCLGLFTSREAAERFRKGRGLDDTNSEIVERGPPCLTNRITVARLLNERALEETEAYSDLLAG